MKVLNKVMSTPTQDGDGVKISRVADFTGQHLDPFLMIDELKSDDEADFIGGFPPHPHRGMETFTYMIKGGFEHRDQLGNRKIIKSGDVQWMSTGFGVVHSEMPVSTDDGMHGFQIWVNMAAKDKLRPAIYQDSVETGLPELHNEAGATLRLLAGQWSIGDNVASSSLCNLSANAAIADLSLQPSGEVVIERHDVEQVLMYVHTGNINGHPARTLLILDPNEQIHAESETGGGALIFSAKKLKEPVAHMGPFVMNTQAELQQAVADYRAGKFGTIGA